jgi:hypothetical protein
VAVASGVPGLDASHGPGDDLACIALELHLVTDLERQA